MYAVSQKGGALPSYIFFNFLGDITGNRVDKQQHKTSVHTRIMYYLYVIAVCFMVSIAYVLYIFLGHRYQITG